MLLKISFVLLLCTKLNQFILILHFIIVIVVGVCFFLLYVLCNIANLWHCFVLHYAAFRVPL